MLMVSLALIPVISIWFTGTSDFLVSNLTADGKLKADGVYEVAT